MMILSAHQLRCLAFLASTTFDPLSTFWPSIMPCSLLELEAEVGKIPTITIIVFSSRPICPITLFLRCSLMYTVVSLAENQ